MISIKNVRFGSKRSLVRIQSRRPFKSLDIIRQFLTRRSRIGVLLFAKLGQRAPSQDISICGKFVEFNNWPERPLINF
jgi:hypothetical protein